MFGPEKIAENLGEFLDYFMVRKVIAGQELLKASGTVTGKLLNIHRATLYRALQRDEREQ